MNYVIYTKTKLHLNGDVLTTGIEHTLKRLWVSVFSNQLKTETIYYCMQFQLLMNVNNCNRFILEGI